MPWLKNLGIRTTLIIDSLLTSIFETLYFLKICLLYVGFALCLVISEKQKLPLNMFMSSEFANARNRQHWAPNVKFYNPADTNIDTLQRTYVVKPLELESCVAGLVFPMMKPKGGGD